MFRNTYYIYGTLASWVLFVFILSIAGWSVVELAIYIVKHISITWG